MKDANTIKQNKHAYKRYQELLNKELCGELLSNEAKELMDIYKHGAKEYINSLKVDVEDIVLTSLRDAGCITNLDLDDGIVFVTAPDGSVWTFSLPIVTDSV